MLSQPLNPSQLNSHLPSSTPAVRQTCRFPSSALTAAVCRYTVVRSGQRRLYVPNAAFLTREFLVVDDPEAGERKRNLEGPMVAPPAHAYVQGPDGHPRWMPVQPFDGYSHYMVDPR